MILRVNFGEDERKILPNFSENEHKIDFHFGEVTIINENIDVKYYDGEYKVIPSPNEQVLKTANRIMKNDVTITAIPYFDVSNNSGGSTVYIANEV